MNTCKKLHRSRSSGHIEEQKMCWGVVWTASAACKALFARLVGAREAPLRSMIARKMRLVLLEHALGTIRLIAACCLPACRAKSSPADETLAKRSSSLCFSRRKVAAGWREPVTRKTRPRTLLVSGRGARLNSTHLELIQFAFAAHLMLNAPASDARQLAISCCIFLLCVLFSFDLMAQLFSSLFYHWGLFLCLSWSGTCDRFDCARGWKMCFWNLNAFFWWT